MKTQDMSHWLDTTNDPISGFAFRAGSARETIGILMWSEIFLANLPSGEEVAIIIMDTQGAFDTDTPGTDCGTIFALSILISSVQIYNLKERIRQDHLQHLQYFSAYGQLLLDSKSTTPFQKLLFLIRDWPFPFEKKFGFEGGEKLLTKALNIENKSEELIALKDSVKESFNDVDCFLMPNPGKIVVSSEFFQGNIQEIDQDFLTQVKNFAPAILEPKNLVLKAVNGQTITVKGLVDLMKTYSTCFKDGKLPEINTLYTATAEIHHTAAMHEAIDEYKKQMEHCKLQEDANKFKTLVLEIFHQRKKMGSCSMGKKYEELLVKELEELFSRNYKNVIERYYYTTVMQEAIGEYKKQMENCKSQEEAKTIMSKVVTDFRERKKMESNTMSKEYKKLLIQKLEKIFSKNYKNGIEKQEEFLLLRYYKAAKQEAIDDYKKQMESCRSQKKAEDIMSQVLKAFHQIKKKGTGPMCQKHKEQLTKELEELFSKNYKNVIGRLEENLLLLHYTAAMQEAIDEYKNQMEHCKSQKEATNVMTKVVKAFRQKKMEGNDTISKEYKS